MDHGTKPPFHFLRQSCKLFIDRCHSVVNGLDSEHFREIVYTFSIFQICRLKNTTDLVKLFIRQLGKPNNKYNHYYDMGISEKSSRCMLFLCLRYSLKRLQQIQKQTQTIIHFTLYNIKKTR